MNSAIDNTEFTHGKRNIFNDEAVWRTYYELQKKEREKSVTYCSTCVLDDSIAGVHLDNEGVCNYCHMQKKMEKDFPGGNVGWQELRKISEKIKKAGKNKPYDIIVGVSGGADSSYILHLAKVELGLRPLAVHFDNTWNSAIATINIAKITKALDVDLYTHVVNNKEFDSSICALLKAGVADFDMQTDLAMAATMNQVAEKYGIQYVFEGHSFRSEGISPAGWLYMDSRYVNDIQKKYSDRGLDSLPHLWLSSQIKWMLINRMKKIRPLWLIDYDKPACMEMLQKKYDWQWYGGHHLENRISEFGHTYFHPRRWGNDQRANGFSGMIRTGLMDRDDALLQLSSPAAIDYSTVELIKKRLGLSDDEFVALMQGPKRNYREFNTYKKTFERMRPFFYLMSRMDLVPRSFYQKYCFPQKETN